MTDSWKLESFDWLPIDSWTVDNLVGPYLNGQGYCKICDKYIDSKELEPHIKKHLKEQERLIKKKKRATSERKRENLRLAREARKSKKEREYQERKYQEGDFDE